MRRIRHRVALLLALLLAAASSGCSLALDSAPSVTNQCRTDADCTDAVCDTARAMCVATGAPSLSVGLEIDVPSSAGTSASVSAVAPFTVTGARALNLRSCADSDAPCIPENLPVAGNVRRADGSAIAADLVFVPDSIIPGRSGATVTAQARAAASAEMYDYRAELAAGGHYEVLVRPTGVDAETLPPRRLSIVVPESAMLFVAPLDYPEALATLNGVLVDADYLPMAGVTVQAIDPVRGVVVSTTVVSGDDSAAAGAGSFSLVLSPDTTDYVLRVGGMTLPGEAPSPTYDVDPAYLVPDVSGSVQILVPQVSPVSYRGSVNVEGDALDMVDGATIEFRSAELLDVRTGATGAYRTTPVTTGSDGSFDVLLVPGTYDVVVRPPSTDTAAALGVYATRVIISDTTGTTLAGQAFELPPRFTYGGSVATADGRHLAGASVQASARGINPSGGLELAMRFNRSSTTTSDATGAFSMPLDRGIYDLAVKPPAGSGFPWVLVKDVGIRATTGNFVREVVFEAPVPVSGTLRDAADRPIEGAEIRAYAIIDVPDLGARSIEIARATSTADGSYMLLLPAHLE